MVLSKFEINLMLMSGGVLVLPACAQFLVSGDDSRPVPVEPCGHSHVSYITKKSRMSGEVRIFRNYEIFSKTAM